MKITKNPFSRTVQMNTIRESEVLVTLIEENAPPVVLGELTSIAYAPQTQTRTINIGGQSGYAYQKTTMTGVQVQFGVKAGTDGSRWRKKWAATQRGQVNSRPGPATLVGGGQQHRSRARRS